jgi:hypothetical protein
MGFVVIVDVLAPALMLSIGVQLKDGVPTRFVGVQLRDVKVP